MAISMVGPMALPKLVSLGTGGAGQMLAASLLSFCLISVHAFILPDMLDPLVGGSLRTRVSSDKISFCSGIKHVLLSVCI